MAGKGDTYENALSSISDFIFSQKKSVNKRKPPKFTGIEPSNEFTKAMMDVISSPAVNLSKQSVDVFNQTIGDQKVLEFFVDKKDADDTSGRVRVQLKDIGGFMNNPTAALDKALAGMEASRKSKGFLGSVGNAYGMVSSFAWAKSAGLSVKEASMLAMSTVNGVPGAYEQESAAKSLIENAILEAQKKAKTPDDFKTLQSLAQKMGVEMVGGPGKTSRNFVGIRDENWEMEARTRPALILSAQSGLGATTDIKKQYMDKYLSKADKAIIEKGDAGDKLKIGERNFYKQFQRDLEKLVKKNSDIQQRYEKARNEVGANVSFADFSNNFNNQIEFASKGANEMGIIDNKTRMVLQENLNNNRFETSGDLKYRQAALVIDQAFNINQGKIKSGLATLDKQMKAMKDEFGSNLPPSYGEFQRTYQKLVSKMNFEKYAPSWRTAIVGGGYGEDGLPKGNQKDLRNMAKATRLMYNSWAEYYEGKPGSEELVGMFKQMARKSNIGAMYNLNMHIGRINYLKGAYDSAVAKGGFWPALLSGGLWDQDFGPGVRYDKYTWDLFDKDFNKREEGLYARKMIMPRDDVPLYRELTGLYYMMPGTILKTVLWNGEGFNYAAAMTQRNMVGYLVTRLGKNQELLKRIYQTPSTSGNIISAVSLVNGKYVLNPGFFKGDGGAKHLNELMKFIDGVGGNSKLVNMYKKFNDRVSRWAKIGKITGAPGRLFDSVSKWFQAKAKAPMVAILKNMSTDAVWQDAVKRFGAGKIGVYQLVEMVVVKVVQALGITGTPIVSLIAGLITSLVMKVLMKVVKPFLALGMHALRGAIAIVLILILALLLMASVTPKAINPLYGVAPYAADRIYPEDIGLEIPDQIGGPIIIDPNATCPIEGIYACTAGPQWHLQYSTYRPAFDARSSGQYWMAPTDGTVEFANTSNMCRDGGNYGGIVKFRDNKGNLYTLVHVIPLVSGGSVQKGRAIAQVQMNLSSHLCWTGWHWHLDVESGGSVVDAKTAYEKLGCVVPGCNPP